MSRVMARPLYHPETDKIELASVLDALSDPLRLQIVARLAEAGECSCSSFLPYGQKTNLTYHLVRLREAGVTQTRTEGPYRIISLRKADLERRFPGLLAAVLASIRRNPPPTPALGESALEAESA